MNYLMKRSYLAVSLIIALAIWSFGQQPLPVALEAEQQIRNVVERFGKAFVEADVSALDSLLHDDYIHTNSNGSVLHKQQWLEYIKTRRRELESRRLEITSYENTGLRIRVYGETAIVTGLNVAKGKREGKEFVTELRFTHVWGKQNGEWKRAAFHDSAIVR